MLATKEAAKRPAGPVVNGGQRTAAVGPRLSPGTTDFVQRYLGNAHAQGFSGGGARIQRT